LSGNVRYKDLMSLFKRYGDIECIDIKESDKGYPYAFIRYYDLKSACAAKKYLNEETLHERCMKIGYGKGCQTNTVMAMEIDRQCPESKVEHEFGKFGELVRMTYNQTLGSALCTYTDTESAQLAIENMRGRCLGRTGRVKVDFANHEECQEFYKNYEQCKASQQLMKYHMDMIAQTTERESRTNKKYDDFKVGDRRGSYDRKQPASPERRDSQYSSSKRFERVERTASRNVRDITPSPPPVLRGRTDRSPGPVDRRPRRSFDNDWKGKGKALPRKYSDEGRIDRDRATSASGRGGGRDEKVNRVVSSRYNSEERELARHIRDSRNSSRERPSERVDFNHSNMKRLSKKPTQRSPSPGGSPTNKYSKYKDSDRSKDFYTQRSSGGRSVNSMMDNDWDKKNFKGDSKRDSRGSSRAEARRDSRVGSPRDRGDEGRDKRKKDRRSTLSEEEEEILNSLIAMRRVEKSRQKKNQRRTDRDGSESRERSKREKSDKDKRKRKRKHSKDSTEDSSEDSSSSSSGTSDGEIDVGNHGNGEPKQQDPDQVPVADTALDRIAKIISDSTNGQVQLNTISAAQPLPSERYSPGENEVLAPPPAMVQTMIPIPPAVVQPLLPPPPIQMTQSKELLGLLRKYPIMWNGSIALKNDTANVQLHFLSGSAGIAEGAINALPNLGPGPMRIAQRMRLEPNQIEGVQKRMQHEGQWCMMLALPHGTDPISVSNQTTTLQHGFIAYLESKQAAGIINLPVPDQSSPYVLHIFPPCDFTQTHMKQFCPELIEGAGDCGYLLIVIATV